MTWNLVPVVVGDDSGVDGEDLRALAAQASAVLGAIEREMDATREAPGCGCDLGLAYVEVRVARDALSGAAAQIDRYIARGNR